jgi:hypothetical protein
MVTKGRVKTHAGSPVKLDGLVGTSVRVFDPWLATRAHRHFCFFPGRLRVKVGDERGVVINMVGCALLTGSQRCVGIRETTEITSLVLQSDLIPLAGSQPKVSVVSSSSSKTCKRPKGVSSHVSACEKPRGYVGRG